MSAAELQQHLEAELLAVNTLGRLLHEESNALLARATPQVLADIAQRKLALFEQLEARGIERDALQAQLGHEAGLAGAEAASAGHPELTLAWQALRDAADEARLQNERNGLYIQTQLKFTTESLAALREAQSRTALYGPKGRPSSATPSAPTRSHRA